jgi:hypothetical protein
VNSLQNLATPEFTPNEIQKLWFATQKQEWSSLVVVPAAPGFSIIPLAKALARAGETYLEHSVRLILGEGTDLNSASRIIIEMTNQVSQGNYVIVAVDSIIQNAAGIPIVLAADACLLGIQLGKSRFAQANRTVEMIGASRFVGAVTLPKPSKRASAKSPHAPPPLTPSASSSPKPSTTSSRGISSTSPSFPPQKPH